MCKDTDCQYVKGACVVDLRGHHAALHPHGLFSPRYGWAFPYGRMSSITLIYPVVGHTFNACDNIHQLCNSRSPEFGTLTYHTRRGTVNVYKNKNRYHASIVLGSGYDDRSFLKWLPYLANDSDDDDLPKLI